MECTMDQLLVNPTLMRTAEERKLSWKVRILFEGPNSKVKGGYSRKWWECNGAGGKGQVYVRYGAFGSGGGRVFGPYTIGEAQKRLFKKLDKGYKLDPRSIDKFPDSVVLKGPLADIHRILKMPGDNRYIAVGKNGHVIVHLDTSGASKLLTMSGQVRRNSPLEVCNELRSPA